MKELVDYYLNLGASSYYLKFLIFFITFSRNTTYLSPSWLCGQYGSVLSKSLEVENKWNHSQRGSSRHGLIIQAKNVRIHLWCLVVSWVRGYDELLCV